MREYEELEESFYRDAYFERLERVGEIMAGNSEHEPGIGRRIAHEHASKLSGGSQNETGGEGGE